MKIKFLQNVELEIFSSPRQKKPSLFTFKAGEETEIDICDDMEPPEASEIQFGDGDISFVTPDFWSAIEILRKD